MTEPSSSSTTGLRTVQYGQELIDFTLVRRNRKTMAITVHPDLSVEVVAPTTARESAILDRVKRRARWILSQQRQFLSWMPKTSRRQFRGGETHRYLGSQYRLKVIKDEQPGVRLRGGFLEVRTPGPSDRQVVKKAVTGWYRNHARERFDRQLQEAYARMRAYDLPKPRLRLLHMSKRWGSCTTSGEVILNPELIKAPSVCIEYVIVHELCHLRHPNHNRAFFEMLEAVLPDWRQRKDRLERVEI